MPHYDAIFLGTGHNALVAQAYLARCGLSTLALDRASAPGGGLRTLENPRLPGFTHHPHSFFHRAITQMPWFRDLELDRHGVRYVQPELNVALLLRDGRAALVAANAALGLALLLSDALNQVHVLPDYHHLIVDEAQDCPDAWWPSLLASLRDPERGRIAVFADEDGKGQGLGSSGSSRPRPMSRKNSAPSTGSSARAEAPRPPLAAFSRRRRA